MKLAYWMYAGPAHIGTLRVASSFKNVHAIMHAPLGDDYFNVMRSMLERERDFTPVTASIVDRHVLARGSQEKVVENITRKNKEESPDLILLTPTCTSSILQEDLHNFVERSTLTLTSVGNNTDTSSVFPEVLGLTPKLPTLRVGWKNRGEVMVKPKATPESTFYPVTTLLTHKKKLGLNAQALCFLEIPFVNKGNKSKILLSTSADGAKYTSGDLNSPQKQPGPKANDGLEGHSPPGHQKNKDFLFVHSDNNYTEAKTVDNSKQDNRTKQNGKKNEGTSSAPVLPREVGTSRVLDLFRPLLNLEVKNDLQLGLKPKLENPLLREQKEVKNQQPDVILADVNHYRVNELQAADRTLEQIVRYYIEKAKKQNNLNITKTEKPSVNIIGIFTLGFHNQHDCRELKRLFNDLGIKINEIIPEGGNVHNLKNLPQAWFNFVPYREVGLMTAVYLKSEFNMPYISITPMGLVDTALCIRAIGKIISNKLIQKNNISNKSSSNICSNSKINKGDLGSNKTETKGGDSEGKNKADILLNLFNKYIDQQTRFVSQAAWFSRSIDCQNLTGKKVVVFGDATHSAAMTKILAREMGIRVSCAGTYCKHDADWFREQVSGFCDQILITDDHTIVGDTIKKLEPAAIFGTQMERHVGKRLDIPCGVISAPVHIQNFPLGYRPFLGYEGTNQIADLVYNSFNLGMEDHLLQIFGGHDSVQQDLDQTNIKNILLNEITTTKKTEFELWSSEGLAELNKVPGFVRGKVKRNTEKYALQNNIPLITVEIMYQAKEALST